MDSITYRLSGDEMWGTVSPAEAPMSLKIGTGVVVALAGLAVGEERCHASESRPQARSKKQK
jgi:hypothetical protein